MGFAVVVTAWKAFTGQLLGGSGGMRVRGGCMKVAERTFTKSLSAEACTAPQAGQSPSGAPSLLGWAAGSFARDSCHRAHAAGNPASLPD